MRSFILVLFSLFTCLSLSADMKNVLFIGNSYTFYNNMPQMVADMAQSTGDTLTFASSTLGGYTLQQHSTNAQTLALISQGAWDCVVLQEQSQYPSFPDGQYFPGSYVYAMFLDSLIHAASPCAETIFYRTWGRENGDQSNCASWPPVCTYEGMDSLLDLRYMLMGNDAGAMVSPVGRVWRAVRDQYYPGIQPYTSDGSHPSLAGSYIVAASMYVSIFDKDPSQITADFGLGSSAQNILDIAKTIAYDDFSTYDFKKRIAPTVSVISYTSAGTNLYDLSSDASSETMDYSWYVDGVLVDSVDQPQSVNLDLGMNKVMLVVQNCFGSDTAYLDLTPIVSHQTEKDIWVYPNPSQGRVQINPDRFAELKSIRLLDMRSRVLRVWDVPVTELDLSNLDAGNYILEMHRIDQSQPDFISIQLLD